MLRQDQYETILIEQRPGGVAVATLNRPDRLNAVSSTMHRELERLPHDVDGDPTVRVLVITGAGRAFCAGGDFGSDPAEDDREPPSAYLNEMYGPRHLVDNMLECEKPVVTAVNGYALGLGATIALLGDIVVAGRSATFGDTHVKMGMSAGDGGQVLWPLLIGPARAKYFLMTGEHIPADDARELGLIQFVVEDDQLMDKALGIADQLAAGPAYAISASKVPINRWMRFVSSHVLPLSLAMEEVSMTKHDHREAVAAFQEKRAPKFTDT